MRFVFFAFFTRITLKFIKIIGAKTFRFSSSSICTLCTIPKFLFIITLWTFIFICIITIFFAFFFTLNSILTLSFCNVKILYFIFIGRLISAFWACIFISSTHITFSFIRLCSWSTYPIIWIVCTFNFTIYTFIITCISITVTF